MIRALAYLLAAYVVGGSLPVLAAETENTVQALLSDCTGAKGGAREMFCIGYVGGIGHLILAERLRDGTIASIAEDLDRCGNATYGSMQRAFINWAHKHPEKWGEPDVAGVEAAIRETWPCNRRR